MKKGLQTGFVNCTTSPFDSCFEVKACREGGKVASEVYAVTMGEILFPNPVDVVEGQIFNVDVSIND